MPIVKRRMQDCDAALASDDGPIFSTVQARQLNRTDWPCRVKIGH
jgi:hypothetical protein